MSYKNDGQKHQSGHRKPIPIVDVFAGPGGLGEGFGSILRANDERAFRIAVSIEKDPIAHRTLTLRAATRAFAPGNLPAVYYRYVRREIDKQQLIEDQEFKEAFRNAQQEAHCLALGPDNHETTDNLVRAALHGEEDWVLIGGPPCQAYSLAGRSRRTKDAQFEDDEKHFLYREYLRLIAKFRPAVFVMENVKGLLSSRHGGEGIFQRILDDLSKPADGLRYRIHAVGPRSGELLDRHNDYVVRAEDYGVPQKRHRIFLVGIREGFRKADPRHLELSARRELVEIIGNLPRIRSRLSKQPDSHKKWLDVLQSFDSTVAMPAGIDGEAVAAAIANACKDAGSLDSFGGPVVRAAEPSEHSDDLLEWLSDERLDAVIQHEARGHMAADLHRYLFAAVFAAQTEQSPKLKDFPPGLLPNHGNATDDQPPFADRFRVQMWSQPSTTIVSHIAKDGHYYIHPEAAQCRSLTVREAARLQTFPDNYFFEGNRTEQYTQVGNAVPPWLARQIGEIVLDLFNQTN